MKFMRPLPKNLGIWKLILILIGSLYLPAGAQEAESQHGDFYRTLIERLGQEGFERDYLQRLFLDPRSAPVLPAMKISLVPQEVPELYSPFLVPDAILLAQTFLRENLTILQQMERRYQVDKEVVVAILLVESRFGENTGRWRVVPTLATLALLDSAESLQRNYLSVLEDDPLVPFEALEQMAKRRAGRAYRELKTFLSILQQEKMDPLEVRGSSAGALGMAQFLPSSYLAYGVAKNGLEGWLLSRDEAIFSVGNYLMGHGWKKNLPIEKKRRVLWTYNHSGPYVDTVLEVSKKIKQK